MSETLHTGIEMGRSFYYNRIAQLEARLKRLPDCFSLEHLTCREEIELSRLKWMQLDRRAEWLKPRNK